MQTDLHNECNCGVTLSVGCKHNAANRSALKISISKVDTYWGVILVSG